MKIITQNIFKYRSVLEKGIGRSPILIDEIKDDRSIQEKLQFFSKVNAQLDKLPGYDCTACGLPSCRVMAEEIVNGNKVLSDCKILVRKEQY